MVRKIIVVALLVTGTLVAQAQVPVSGAPGVTLRRLVGTPTLVTVVLRGSEARDANLKVVDIHEDAVVFRAADNELVPYLYEDLAQIVVQGEFVPESSFELDLDRALSPEHERVVNRAIERAREIFNSSADNQALRMRAAVLLGVSGEQEAIDYLKDRATANDVETQLAAAVALYYVGEDIDRDIIDLGLASSVRNGRITAAKLAGLIGYREAVPEINELFQDRSSDYFVPAAMALARLGERESIPRLLETLPQRNPEKAEAAVWALIRLGGDDVVEQLRIRLRDATGPYRFRLVHILYALGDPIGQEEMVNLFRNVRNEAYEAAMKLAVDGNLEAKSDLQQRMEERIDTTDENLTQLGETAVALIRSGDLSAQATIQKLLTDESATVRKAVCEQITQLGNRRLMTLIQANVENADPDIALAAGTTAVSLANGAFRSRLVEARED